MSLFKRFRFRFSVRTLVAAITILGMLLGCVGNEVNRLRLHRQAEERIEELGGSYGSASDGKWCEPLGPWWCPVVRDGLYAEEEIVWFNSTNNDGLRDEDLQVLRHFPRLTRLEISAPLITDEALVHIERMRTLRELHLNGTQVTGRGLKRLRGIPLQMLVLYGPAITDEATEALAAFPDLRRLIIANTAVTDVGLANLLEKLFITECPVSDAGLSTLQQLIHLHELDLEDLAITDLGIAPLACPAAPAISERRRHSGHGGRAIGISRYPRIESLDIGRQQDSGILLRVSSSLPGCHVWEGGGFRCMQGW